MPAAAAAHDLSMQRQTASAPLQLTGLPTRPLWEAFHPTVPGMLIPRSGNALIDRPLMCFHWTGPYRNSRKSLDHRLSSLSWSRTIIPLSHLLIARVTLRQSLTWQRTTYLISCFQSLHFLEAQLHMWQNNKQPYKKRQNIANNRAYNIHQELPTPSQFSEMSSPGSRPSSTGSRDSVYAQSLVLEAQKFIPALRNVPF